MALPIGWLAIVFTCAFGAGHLPFQSPASMDFDAVQQGPSAAHLLGTDLDGRNAWRSRICQSGRPLARATVTNASRSVVARSLRSRRR